MAREVSVNLFDVEFDSRRTQRLTRTLDEFHALPLDQRWRDEIRIERIEIEQVHGQRVYLMDFAKKREVGPGRLAAGTAIASIRLAHDEDFGEETAALYCPRKRWLMVLHNQAGVGPTRMMQYFNALDPGNAARHFDYKAVPKLDPTVTQRFRGMRNFSSVKVTATVDSLSAMQVQTGASLAAASRSAGARRVTFELAANEPYKKGRWLDRVQAMSLISALRGDDDVTKLQVKGDVGGHDQMIDLIEHKVRRRYSTNELQVLHHRYTLASRWSLLKRTYPHWVDTL